MMAKDHEIVRALELICRLCHENLISSFVHGPSIVV